MRWDIVYSIWGMTRNQQAILNIIYNMKERSRRDRQQKNSKRRSTKLKIS